MNASGRYGATRVAGVGFAVLLVVASAVVLVAKPWQHTDTLLESSDNPPRNTVAASGSGTPTAPRTSGRGENEGTPTPQADELRAVWGLADEDNQSAFPKVREDIPATLIQLDRPAVMALATGDTVLLPIGADAAVTFSVERVRTHEAYGVTSFRGSVIGDGVSLPAVITIGEQSTLASISAPSGAYELRGNARTAWLYRVEDLGIPGGDVVDYVIPGQDVPGAASGVSPPGSPSTE